MEKALRTRLAMARFHAGRGRLRAFGCASILAVLAACTENLSPGPTGSGPDTTGPLVRLEPAHDTLVDSTGTLLVRVSANDRSGVRTVDFLLIPARFSFGTLTPNDTTFDAFYPITLGDFKHSSFKYYARSSDVLDHETVTDTVTVTVR